MIFGTIAGIVTALIIRKIYLRKKRERIERDSRESMENARRKRRQQQRPHPDELRHEEKCVVCVQNPKEVISIINGIDCIAIQLTNLYDHLFQIICLPCGHVCLCGDCSEHIKDVCPVCRARIENRSVAFIS